MSKINNIEDVLEQSEYIGLGFENSEDIYIPKSKVKWISISDVYKEIIRVYDKDFNHDGYKINKLSLRLDIKDYLLLEDKYKNSDYLYEEGLCTMTDMVFSDEHPRILHRLVTDSYLTGVVCIDFIDKNKKLIETYYLANNECLEYKPINDRYDYVNIHADIIFEGTDLVLTVNKDINYEELYRDNLNISHSKVERIGFIFNNEDKIVLDKRYIESLNIDLDANIVNRINFPKGIEEVGKTIKELNMVLNLDKEVKGDTYRLDSGERDRIIKIQEVHDKNTLNLVLNNLSDVKTFIVCDINNNILDKYDIKGNSYIDIKISK